MIAAARSVTVTFGARTALDDVSVDVTPGQVVALVGGDGAGKTTLLRTFVGELAPDSGVVEAPDKHQIGYLSAGPGSWSALTVRQNLDFVGGIYGLTGDELVERVRDHDQHGKRRQQAECAVGADQDRLDDDEIDAHDAERPDHDPEQRPHPRHRPPAQAATHDSHQDLEHVAHGAKSAIGDGPGFRDIRGDDEFGAVQDDVACEERLPNALDMSELVCREHTRDDKPDRAERKADAHEEIARQRMERLSTRA